MGYDEIRNTLHQTATYHCVAAFKIHLIRDIPKKTDGFEQLVLPPGHKELVRALVKTHDRVPEHGGKDYEEHQVDLVKGKGN